MKKTNETKDRVYVLSGGKSPLSQYIPSRDTRRSRLLFTDENGSNRAMRYSINHKSPFIDEQDDTAILEPIVFEEGFLKVSKSNKSLQDFLEIHPGNEANGGGTFYLSDPEKDAEERMAELDLRTDAIIAVKSLDFSIFFRDSFVSLLIFLKAIFASSAIFLDILTNSFLLSSVSGGTGMRNNVPSF